MAKKPLEIDACAGSQLRDTQGEMLSVEGADISDLIAGKGRWNDNHGKGFFNSIGRITGAKKIFKEEDCEDDRQRYYWEKVKAPYIFVKGYLYSDEDHPNAKAAAAILRNIHKADTPLKLKASVEGGVLSRGISDPSLLARTKIHSVALTFTPANNATLVEPTTMEKSVDEAADLELIKSVMHLAETNIPSFRHIVRDASASRVHANLERIVELMKGDDSIDIPTKQEIIQYALEAKIQTNIVKIHELVEELSNENIEKGLKQAAMGAAMIGASALAPQASPASPLSIKAPPKVQQQPQNLKNMPVEHQHAFEALGREMPIVIGIGCNESNCGNNYAHKTEMGKNMHRGHTAGGAYGIMPIEAMETLKHDKALQRKYPELFTAGKDIKKNHKTLTNAINSNTTLSNDLMRSGMKRRLKLFKGDTDKAIYSHRHGITATLKAKPTSIGSDPYVVSAKKRATDPTRGLASTQETLKSLTAGFGGGAAPTSRVGGAVLQCESLENDGRQGLKYATCDDCGKEQVYAKHQVKCRDCGKSWSLDKLHRVMLGLKG